MTVISFWCQATIIFFFFLLFMHILSIFHATELSGQNSFLLILTYSKSKARQTIKSSTISEQRLHRIRSIAKVEMLLILLVSPSAQ